MKIRDLKVISHLSSSRFPATGRRDLAERQDERADVPAALPEDQHEPVRRLDILLYSGSGKFLGVMARLRDLLPGSYSFGITGRGPTSTRLAPGTYELRLAAWPTLPLDAKPHRLQVSFQLE